MGFSNLLKLITQKISGEDALLFNNRIQINIKFAKHAGVDPLKCQHLYSSSKLLKNIMFPLSDCKGNIQQQISGIQRPKYNFLVSRKARDKYSFDLNMFSIHGNVIFANFYAAQLFAQKMNEERDVIHHPEASVSAADINAMGLIHEILHHLIELYRQTRNSNVFQEALERLEGKFSQQEIDKSLEKFVDEFPPLEVYQQKLTIKKYLQGASEGRAHREIALEEMLLLWLANQNPAFQKYDELFDDAALEKETVYPQVMNDLQLFFDEQPLFGPAGAGMNLIQALLQPALKNPGSLAEQLHLLRENWGEQLSAMLNVKWDLLLGKAFTDVWGVPVGQYDTRLLRASDFIIEETKMRFNPGSGTAPTHTLEFQGAEFEPEAFSPDMHWMPRLVLMAKSTLVWLDQLSKKYQREITRLDQIPDAELDQLARWGFTGLWLIGIWERSSASKEIKRMCGNPEAAASAYSLYDYAIAKEIGGDAAYQNLKDRAWKRGIRMGSDMVPNHTGIVSKWVIEHPDWYVQLPYPPFPSYTFNGVDLCKETPDVGIFLEDHYYDRTDAAVVFKRVDYRSGQSRYIYHGNDGTSMAWNDTAQLDYTKKDVREAVIHTIIEVAKKFPIIRFDAAMTLAKRHYQRLWFPQPGSGGDIPSRAQHGLTKAQFDAVFPQEFWREVVDRIAVEAPDTLLLAEAFWMMEGYFVRSLGMHRVYNSAFMNMLKNEENKKYRYTIKNTIEFEPEVLRRYVNFMNNPDEDTAIDQFGDGDKYFGVCAMMATMPGLPMFGHGQIEGFHEKYGMEYRRAYYDEQPNQYLVERHEREIFPLLKKRYLFAEVEQFLLYDLYQQDGTVNENVFAYSNRFGDERSLVVFHNAFAETRGWIHTSAAFSEKITDFPGDESAQKRLVQKTLGEGLGLPNGEHFFLIFRDYIGKMEYIYNCQTLWQQGMYVELGAYKYRVFLDFRVVADDAAGQYRRLCDELGGRGVASVDEALREMYLQPLHNAFRQFANGTVIEKLLHYREAHLQHAKFLDEIAQNYAKFIETAGQEFNENPNSSKNQESDKSREKMIAALRKQLAVFFAFDAASLKKKYPAPKRSPRYFTALDTLKIQLGDGIFAGAVLVNWLFVHNLGALNGAADPALRSRSLLDEWLLHKPIRSNLRQLGLKDKQVEEGLSLIKLLTRHQQWLPAKGTAKKRAADALENLLKSTAFQQFIGVNRFEDVLWFNKESFGKAAGWLFTIAAFQTVLQAESSDEKKSAKAKQKPAKIKAKSPAELVGKRLAEIQHVLELWLKAEERSEYRVDELLEGVTDKGGRIKDKGGRIKDKVKRKIANPQKAKTAKNGQRKAAAKRTKK